jgi:hypothetical protein
MDEKADIVDGASNLGRHGLPSLLVSFPEWGNVDNGNIKQHFSLRSGEHCVRLYAEMSSVNRGRTVGIGRSIARQIGCWLGVVRAKPPKQKTLARQ